MAETLEQVFYVKGMDCAACATTITSGVKTLVGVEDADVSFSTERLIVRGEISKNEIVNRVEALGYQLFNPEVEQAQPSESKNFFQYLWSQSHSRNIVFAMILILPGLLFEELLPNLIGQSIWISISSIFAMVLAGFPVIKSAWQSVRYAREININVLMTIASIGAVLIGAYSEAAVVMVLFAIGESLEGFTANKARNSIKELMFLAPKKAFLLKESGGREINYQVEIDSLAIGDLILVKPGEKIPMDGEVISGVSNVDQSPITGESKLILKEKASIVYAGSFNHDGVIEILVTHLSKDTVVSKMIRMVEDAQENKAPAQRFVDRFAKVYTPIVVVIAALVVIIPVAFMGLPLIGESGISSGWLYKGLTLLVVACPCALVISTPISIISAISNGANQGVLFKGGAFLETLSGIKGIAFDKTGTLTKGKPTVVGVYGKDCTSDGEEDCEDCIDILSLANAVESRSEHPLAAAINFAAINNERVIGYPVASDVRAIVGKGIEGKVGNKKVLVGSHPYFDDTIAHEEYCEEVQTAAEQGYTTMLIGEGDRYRGYITIEDEVRENSAAVISELKDLNINPLVMLTGDNPQTAKNIGDKIGIDNIEANCLPEDKVKRIKEYQATYGDFAMVGDGINDLPALASANLGIAIGNIDHALDTADITLMRNNLALLPFAIRLSRKTMSTIRMNVFLSIAIKLLFLVTVILGFGTMWMAVIADVGTSILVSLLGMRLLKTPRL